MPASHETYSASLACDARAREVICSTPSLRPNTDEWRLLGQLQVLSTFTFALSNALEQRESADADVADIFARRRDY